MFYWACCCLNVLLSIATLRMRSIDVGFYCRDVGFYCRIAFNALSFVAVLVVYLPHVTVVILFVFSVALLLCRFIVALPCFFCFAALLLSFD